jgi:hypothetical protein
MHSLQTALHDGFFKKSAEEAIVTAVNRGGDTDTIDAIAGAVAGDGLEHPTSRIAGYPLSRSLNRLSGWQIDLLRGHSSIDSV